MAETGAELCNLCSERYGLLCSRALFCPTQYKRYSIWFGSPTIEACDQGPAEVARLNEQVISMTIVINLKETTLYEYKSDLELFAFIKNNFIPVSELVARWMS